MIKNILVFFLLFVEFNGCAFKNNNNINLIVNHYQSLLKSYELFLIQTQKQLEELGENKKNITNLHNELNLSKKLLNSLNKNDETIKKTLLEHIETINTKIKMINKSNLQIDFLEKALNYSQIVLNVLLLMEEFELSLKYKNQFVKTNKNFNFKQAFEALEKSYQLLIQQNNNSLEIDELFQDIKNKHKIFLKQVSKLKKKLYEMKIKLTQEIKDLNEMEIMFKETYKYLITATKLLELKINYHNF
jgi:hypothetical protein